MQDEITREHWIALIVIAFAAFMASLDSTIVNISLPTIAGSFGVDISIVSWVVLAYLLVLAGLLLVFGRLGDLHGFRRIFIAGFAVFTLGSLLCGLSATIYHLIASRALQGIGGAALEALAPAMVLLYLPASRRGWALGILATVVSLGIAAGPILGGFITEYLSWHWIFLINVPVGIIAVILAARYLPADVPSGKNTGFDSSGATLIMAALITLLFPLNQGLELGWTSPLILSSLCASGILWAVFVVHERRCESPLLDLGLFSSRNYLLGNAAGFLLMMVYDGSIFLLPFFFEIVQGRSTETAGLLLALPAVAMILVGPAAGAFSDRYGSRLPTTVAALIAAVALWLFSLFNPGTGLLVIIASMLIIGIAIGFFFPPNMSQILGSGGNEGEGVASSVMMTVRNTGAVFGVAIFGTIVVQVIIGRMEYQHVVTASPEVLSAGFAVAFTLGILLCLAGAVISAASRDEREAA
jgi:DHA2 family metal-tetracycline-proton antiporter-like MFS transporter